MVPLFVRNLMTAALSKYARRDRVPFRARSTVRPVSLSDRLDRPILMIPKDIPKFEELIFGAEFTSNYLDKLA